MKQRFGASFPSLAVCAVLALQSGCVGIKVGTKDDSSAFQMQGLANGYATVDALRPYDGTILEFGLLGRSARRGEVVSLDLWPLFGVGVGLAGARVRLLPLEVGFGTLFYNPKPLPPAKPEDGFKEEEEEEDGAGEDKDENDSDSNAGGSDGV